MMITPTRVGVLLILLLIVALASWSKLRFVDENAEEPQRWRVEEYPGLQKNQINSLLSPTTNT